MTTRFVGQAVAFHAVHTLVPNAGCAMSLGAACQRLQLAAAQRHTARCDRLTYAGQTLECKIFILTNLPLDGRSPIVLATKGLPGPLRHT